MTTDALDLWGRACESLQAAAALAAQRFWDAAASRAYYAAFYAVSALLAVEGKTFTKHTAVESAVHRDLVKSGRWPVELGALYSSLQDLRSIGDYGGERHAAAEDVAEAVASARRIVEAVHDLQPRLFVM